MMQILWLLARVNLNCMECRELVARVQKIIIEREHARQHNKLVEDPRLVEQAVDTRRVQTLERDAAHKGRSAREAHNLGFGSLDFFEGYNGGEDHISVGFYVGYIGDGYRVGGEPRASIPGHHWAACHVG